MVQFGNILYFELAALLSLIFLSLSLFNLRRCGCLNFRQITRSALWSGIIIFLGMIISGARLDWKRSIPIKEKAEIIFAIDVSLSSLAKDATIKSSEETKKVSRLEMEKYHVKKIVEALKDDAIGLIVFADIAIPLQYVLSKEDYQNSILRNLEFVDEDFVKRGVKQGTDYGNLIIESFGQFSGKNSAKKLLFIITDGEPQGNQEQLQKNMKKAVGMMSYRNDVNIYLIGVGDQKEPSRIPKTEDEYGNPKEYYTKKNGEFIFTRPNPEFLAGLANATGGQYIHADSDQNLKNIILSSIEWERKTIRWEEKKELIDMTPYLLIVSLFFLLIIPILKSV